MDVDLVNAIALNSLDDSTIAKLSLYTDRAQLTRMFKVNLLTGRNIVSITSLPNVIDHDSLKVEGHGPAIIQGVTSYKAKRLNVPMSSPVLVELVAKQEKAKAALARANKALKAIDIYMDKLDARNLDISKLGEAMEAYDATEEKWDEKVLELERELEVLGEEIAKERSTLKAKVGNKKLRGVVVISFSAQQEAEVSLCLTYSVSKAKWEAGYDVRVDTQQVDGPATVVYKANITQETGEDWTDAPITLETATPTFGVVLPFLDTWNVTLTAPVYAGARRGRTFTDEDDSDYMLEDETVVTSKGHVNATFRIPGITSIPSSKEERIVTIVSLELEAKMSWACIPKGDARVHLRATIKNSSDYTFLPGDSNVYVDQSFVARSFMSSVRPQETFICPLGLDPSIRVIYHPATKHASSSGFYNKSKIHSFSQRISIHNTKSIPMDGLKITDQIPVSQDANLSVTLISPALSTPTSSLTLSDLSKIVSANVRVSDTVTAQWHGADESDVDTDALGQDGKLDWICGLAAFGKLNLLLQWELSTPQGEQVYGI